MGVQLAGNQNRKTAEAGAIKNMISARIIAVEVASGENENTLHG